MSTSRKSLLAAAVGAALLAQACGGEQPNLILIVVDTLRADHVDPLAAKADTPAMLALALDGVRFESAFSHAPMTLPAHAALFSSRLPSDAGVLDNGARVSADVPLLADWLAEHGYANLGAVSLATMWPREAGNDLARGFERYEFDPERECDDAEAMKRRFDALLAARPKNRPFFLFAHLSDPHEPYDAFGTADERARLEVDGVDVAELAISDYAPLETTLELAGGLHEIALDADVPFKLRRLEVSDPSGVLNLAWTLGEPLRPTRLVRAAVKVPAGGSTPCRVRVWAQEVLTPEQAAARYRLEVERADRALGELFEDLRRAGSYRDSWIVLTSDHGESLGEHGVVGHVVNLHDELLHVPLIVKPPRGDAALPVLAARRAELVRHIDLVPTLLDALDLPPLPGQAGASLLAAGERVLTAETHAPMAPRDLVCMRDTHFKLVHEPARDRFELYDLAGDPAELHDVFATRGAERAAWQLALRELAARPRAAAPPGDARLRELHALGY